VPICAIAISNQETRTQPEGGGVSKLVCDPAISWVSGDNEVDDPSGTQLHDKEKIELEEKKVNGWKEITHLNVWSMVLEKNRPGLAR
jgi:hypothetical protein